MALENPFVCTRLRQQLVSQKEFIDCFNAFTRTEPSQYVQFDCACLLSVLWEHQGFLQIKATALQDLSAAGFGNDLVFDKALSQQHVLVAVCYNLPGQSVDAAKN